MMEWFEDLLDKPPRQKALVLALGSFLLWALGWVTVVGARWDSLAALRAEAREDEQRLEDLEKKAANLEKVREQVQQLDREISAALARLPDRKEIPDLLNTVSEMASESGLRITKFRQLDEQLQDYYAEVPVELSMVGSFHQMAAFFDRVPRLNRLINVTGISLRRPSVVASGIQVEASCLATTFRFLDEKERAEAAKAKEAGKGGKKQGGTKPDGAKARGNKT
jgi:type IV pilus assembly protein PilO